MKNGFKKRIAGILLLTMLFTAVGFSGGIGVPEKAYGAESAVLGEAVERTVTGYYQQQRGKTLADWEEVVAVAASGEELTEYALPGYTEQVPASDLILALIAGDLDSAAEKAEAARRWITSPGAVPGYGSTYDGGMAYGYTILALEAYNRSVPAEERVVYGTEAAIRRLVTAYSGGTEYTFGYSFGGSQLDTDSAGLALAALSLFRQADGVEEHIAKILGELRSAQDASGGFASNANATASVLWGLLALNENLSGGWATGSGVTVDPVDGLLTYLLEGGGYRYDASGGNANPFATKQAQIAAADAHRQSLQTGAPPFYASFRLGEKQYVAVDVRVVDQEGQYRAVRAIAADREMPEDRTAAKAIQAALKTDVPVNTSDYRIFVNGALKEDAELAAYRIQSGDTILAVEDDFTSVWYFADPADPRIGVPEKSVVNGGTQTLTVMAMDLLNGSTEPKAGVYVAGDGALLSGGSYTAETGQIAVTPVTALKVYHLTMPKRVPYPDRENVPDGTVALPATVVMQAGEAQSLSGVRVRIEGPHANLLYATDLTVGNTDGSRLTVFDAVKQAMESKAVPYENSGSYIYSIGGIGAMAYGGFSGWVYTFPDDAGYLNSTKMAGAMDQELLSEHRDILIYYGNAGWTTVYPVVRTKKNTNGTVTIFVHSYGYGATEAANPLSGVSLIWSRGTPSEYRAVTDASGTAAIPATAAAVGVHTLEASKLTDAGPDIVPLPPGYTIIVSAGGTSVTPPVVTDRKAYLSVAGPTGILKARTGISWYQGMTALSLLQQSGLTISYDASGSYVRGINGIYEFDYGAGSGWMYSVDGVTPPTTPANQYMLSESDEVRWYYTRDYTQDPSSAAWSGSGGSGGTPAALSAVTETVSTVTGNDGIARGAVSTDRLNAAVESALKASAAQGSTGASVILDLKTGVDAKGMEAAVPGSAFANLVQKGILKLTVQSALGSIALDAEALRDVSKAGTGDILFALKQKPEKESRPVISLSVSNGGKAVEAFSKPLLVTVPYRAAAGEAAQGIVVFQLDADGARRHVRAMAYDDKTQTVRFRADNASDFVIAYNYKTFGDIQGHWAQSSVEALASRDIIRGMTPEAFAPDTAVTRAQFVALLAGLANAEVHADRTSQFGDVAADAWYSGAAAWAAENGIVQGLPGEAGGVLFAPNQTISRQDMAVIVGRYLSWAKEPLKETGAAAAFSDEAGIADYARSSVSAMQKAGLIQGKPGSGAQLIFDPRGQLTRGEAAKLLVDQQLRQL